MPKPSPFAQAVSRRVKMLAAGDRITRQQISERIGVDVSGVSMRLNGRAEFRLSELEDMAPLFRLADPAEFIPHQ